MKNSAVRITVTLSAGETLTDMYYVDMFSKFRFNDVNLVTVETLSGPCDG